jgi:hypothetical protein
VLIVVERVRSRRAQRAYHEWRPPG